MIVHDDCCVFNKDNMKQFDINIGDVVGFVIQEEFDFVVKRTFKVGIWDGEKAILKDNRIERKKYNDTIIVRKKDWLFKIKEELTVA